MAGRSWQIARTMIPETYWRQRIDLRRCSVRTLPLALLSPGSLACISGLEGDSGADNIRRTVIEMLSDGLLPEGYRVIRVDSGGLWVRHGGKTFPIREMSDGYRTVTALVLDIVRGIYGFYRRPIIRRINGSIEVRSPGLS